MHAGALHTIITDGVRYPQRAAKRVKTSDGKCVLTQDCNIYGGNAAHATRCQTWGGRNSKRSEHK
eukprot:9163296-Heterocapsa_arctica.AAC.1